MSEPTLERFVGVDVSKDWLDLCADPPTPDLASHVSYDDASLHGYVTRWSGCDRR